MKFKFKKCLLALLIQLSLGFCYAQNNGGSLSTLENYIDSNNYEPESATSCGLRPFVDDVSPADESPDTYTFATNVPALDINLAQTSSSWGDWLNYLGNLTLTSETQTVPVILQMDVYKPTFTMPNGNPCVVLGFGGAFLTGSRTQIELVNFAKELTKKGYVVVLPDYRLGFNVAKEIWDDYGISPEGVEQLSNASSTRAVYRATQDIRSCIRYLRANSNTLGINPNSIFAGGNSAGAIASLHAAFLTNDIVNEDPLLEAINGQTLTYNMFTGQYDYQMPDLGDLDIGQNLSYSGYPNAVLNLWGAIGKKEWLNTNNIPVVSFHGQNDLVVPYIEGNPYGLAMDLNFAGYNYTYKYLPDMYGSASIDNYLDNNGNISEYHGYWYPVSTGHELWKSNNNFNDIVEEASEFLSQFVILPDGPVLVGHSEESTYGINTEIEFDYISFVPNSHLCVDIQSENLTLLNIDEVNHKIKFRTGAIVENAGLILTDFEDLFNDNERIVKSKKNKKNIKIQLTANPYPGCDINFIPPPGAEISSEYGITESSIQYSLLDIINAYKNSDQNFIDDKLKFLIEDIPEGCASGKVIECELEMGIIVLSKTKVTSNFYNLFEHIINIDGILDYTTLDKLLIPDIDMEFSLKFYVNGYLEKKFSIYIDPISETTTCPSTLEYEQTQDGDLFTLGGFGINNFDVIVKDVCMGEVNTFIPLSTNQILIQNLDNYSVYFIIYDINNNICNILPYSKNLFLDNYINSSCYFESEELENGLIEMASNASVSIPDGTNNKFYSGTILNYTKDPFFLYGITSRNCISKIPNPHTGVNFKIRRESCDGEFMNTDIKYATIEEISMNNGDQLEDLVLFRIKKSYFPENACMTGYLGNLDGEVNNNSIGFSIGQALGNEGLQSVTEGYLNFSNSNEVTKDRICSFKGLQDVESFGGGIFDQYGRWIGAISESTDLNYGTGNFYFEKVAKNGPLSETGGSTFKTLFDEHIKVENQNITSCPSKSGECISYLTGLDADQIEILPKKTESELKYIFNENLDDNYMVVKPSPTFYLFVGFNSLQCYNGRNITWTVESTTNYPDLNFTSSEKDLFFDNSWLEQIKYYGKGESPILNHTSFSKELLYSYPYIISCNIDYEDPQRNDEQYSFKIVFIKEDVNVNAVNTKCAEDIFEGIFPNLFGNSAIALKKNSDDIDTDSDDDVLDELNSGVLLNTYNNEGKLYALTSGHIFANTNIEDWDVYFGLSTESCTDFTAPSLASLPHTKIKSIITQSTNLSIDDEDGQVLLSYLTDFNDYALLELELLPQMPEDMVLAGWSVQSPTYYADAGTNPSDPDPFKDAYIVSHGYGFSNVASVDAFGLKTAHEMAGDMVFGFETLGGDYSGYAFSANEGCVAKKGSEGAPLFSDDYNHLIGIVAGKYDIEGTENDIDPCGNPLINLCSSIERIVHSDPTCSNIFYNGASTTLENINHQPIQDCEVSILVEEAEQDLVGTDITGEDVLILNETNIDGYILGYKSTETCPRPNDIRWEVEYFGGTLTSNLPDLVLSDAWFGPTENEIKIRCFGNFLNAHHSEAVLNIKREHPLACPVELFSPYNHSLYTVSATIGNSDLKEQYSVFNAVPINFQTTKSKLAAGLAFKVTGLDCDLEDYTIGNDGLPLITWANAITNTTSEAFTYTIQSSTTEAGTYPLNINMNIKGLTATPLIFIEVLEDPISICVLPEPNSNYNSTEIIPIEFNILNNDLPTQSYKYVITLDNVVGATSPYKAVIEGTLQEQGLPNVINLDINSGTNNFINAENEVLDFSTIDYPLQAHTHLELGNYTDFGFEEVFTKECNDFTILGRPIIEQITNGEGEEYLPRIRLGKNKNNQYGALLENLKPNIPYHFKWVLLNSNHDLVHELPVQNNEQTFIPTSTNYQINSTISDVLIPSTDIELQTLYGNGNNFYLGLLTSENNLSLQEIGVFDNTNFPANIIYNERPCEVRWRFFNLDVYNKGGINGSDDIGDDDYYNPNNLPADKIISKRDISIESNNNDVLLLEGNKAYQFKYSLTTNLDINEIGNGPLFFNTYDANDAQIVMAYSDENEDSYNDICHEILTPLNTISGCLPLILNDNIRKIEIGYGDASAFWRITEPNAVFVDIMPTNITYTYTSNDVNNPFGSFIEDGNTHPIFGYIETGNEITISLSPESLATLPESFNNCNIVIQELYKNNSLFGNYLVGTGFNYTFNNLEYGTYKALISIGCEESLFSTQEIYFDIQPQMTLSYSSTAGQSGTITTATEPLNVIEPVELFTFTLVPPAGLAEMIATQQYNITWTIDNQVMNVEQMTSLSWEFLTIFPENTIEVSLHGIGAYSQIIYTKVVQINSDQLPTYIFEACNSDDPNVVNCSIGFINKEKLIELGLNYELRTIGTTIIPRNDNEDFETTSFSITVDPNLDYKKTIYLKLYKIGEQTNNTRTFIVSPGHPDLLQCIDYMNEDFENFNEWENVSNSVVGFIKTNFEYNPPSCASSIFGTGTLLNSNTIDANGVRKRYILTATHVVLDGETDDLSEGDLLEKTALIFGYRKDGPEVSDTRYEYIYDGNIRVIKMSKVLDIVLLELEDELPPNICYQGWGADISMLSDADIQYMAIGHGMKKTQHVIKLYDNITPPSPKPGLQYRVVQDGAMYHGHSGGGIIDIENKKVHGVISSSFYYDMGSESLPILQCSISNKIQGEKPCSIQKNLGYAPLALVYYPPSEINIPDYNYSDESLVLKNYLNSTGVENKMEMYCPKYSWTEMFYFRLIKYLFGENIPNTQQYYSSDPSTWEAITMTEGEGLEFLIEFPNEFSSFIGTNDFQQNNTIKWTLTDNETAEATTLSVGQNLTQTLESLAAGNYTLTVIAQGDEQYYFGVSSSITIPITVLPACNLQIKDGDGAEIVGVIEIEQVNIPTTYFTLVPKSNECSYTNISLSVNNVNDVSCNFSISDMTPLFDMGIPTYVFNVNTLGCLNLVPGDYELVAKYKINGNGDFITEIQSFRILPNSQIYVTTKNYINGIEQTQISTDYAAEVTLSLGIEGYNANDYSAAEFVVDEGSSSAEAYMFNPSNNQYNFVSSGVDAQLKIFSPASQLVGHWVLHSNNPSFPDILSPPVTIENGLMPTPTIAVGSGLSVAPNYDSPQAYATNIQISNAYCSTCRLEFYYDGILQNAFYNALGTKEDDYLIDQGELYDRQSWASTEYILSPDFPETPTPWEIRLYRESGPLRSMDFVASLTGITPAPNAFNPLTTTDMLIHSPCNAGNGVYSSNCNSNTYHALVSPGSTAVNIHFNLEFITDGVQPFEYSISGLPGGNLSGQIGSYIPLEFDRTFEIGQHTLLVSYWSVGSDPSEGRQELITINASTEPFIVVEEGTETGSSANNCNIEFEVEDDNPNYLDLQNGLDVSIGLSDGCSIEGDFDYLVTITNQGISHSYTIAGSSISSSNITFYSDMDEAYFMALGTNNISIEMVDHFEIPIFHGTLQIDQGSTLNSFMLEAPTEWRPDSPLTISVGQLPGSNIIFDNYLYCFEIYKSIGNDEGPYTQLYGNFITNNLNEIHQEIFQDTGWYEIRLCILNDNDANSCMDEDKVCLKTIEKRIHIFEEAILPKFLTISAEPNNIWNINNNYPFKVQPLIRLDYNSGLDGPIRKVEIEWKYKPNGSEEYILNTQWLTVSDFLTGQLGFANSSPIFELIGGGEIYNDTAGILKATVKRVRRLDGSEVEIFSGVGPNANIIVHLPPKPDWAGSNDCNFQDLADPTNSQNKDLFNIDMWRSRHQYDISLGGWDWDWVGDFTFGLGDLFGESIYTTNGTSEILGIGQYVEEDKIQYNKYWKNTGDFKIDETNKSICINKNIDRFGISLLPDFNIQDEFGCKIHLDEKIAFWNFKNITQNKTLGGYNQGFNPYEFYRARCDLGAYELNATDNVLIQNGQFQNLLHELPELFISESLLEQQAQCVQLDGFGSFTQIPVSSGFNEYEIEKGVNSCWYKTCSGQTDRPIIMPTQNVSSNKGFDLFWYTEGNEHSSEDLIVPITGQYFSPQQSSDKSIEQYLIDNGMSLNDEYYIEVGLLDAMADPDANTNRIFNRYKVNFVDVEVVSGIQVEVDNLSTNEIDKFEFYQQVDCTSGDPTTTNYPEDPYNITDIEVISDACGIRLKPTMDFDSWLSLYPNLDIEQIHEDLVYNYYPSEYFVSSAIENAVIPYAVLQNLPGNFDIELMVCNTFNDFCETKSITIENPYKHIEVELVKSDVCNNEENFIIVRSAIPMEVGIEYPTINVLNTQQFAYLPSENITASANDYGITLGNNDQLWKLNYILLNTYPVNVLVNVNVNVNGCTNTNVVSFVVHPNTEQLPYNIIDNNICSGSQIALELPLSLNYSWDVAGTSISGGSAGSVSNSPLSINDILTTSGTMPKEYIYTIKSGNEYSSNGGHCYKDLYVPVVVQPSTNISISASSDEVCANEPFTVNITGTHWKINPLPEEVSILQPYMTGEWYSNNGNPLWLSFTNISDESKMVTIRTKGGCDGIEEKEVSILIHPYGVSSYPEIIESNMCTYGVSNLNDLIEQTLGITIEEITILGAKIPNAYTGENEVYFGSNIVNLHINSGNEYVYSKQEESFPLDEGIHEFFVSIKTDDALCGKLLILKLNVDDTVVFSPMEIFTADICASESITIPIATNIIFPSSESFDYAVNFYDQNNISFNPNINIYSASGISYLTLNGGIPLGVTNFEVYATPVFLSDLPGSGADECIYTSGLVATINIVQENEIVCDSVIYICTGSEFVLEDYASLPCYNGEYSLNLSGHHVEFTHDFYLIEEPGVYTITAIDPINPETPIASLQVEIIPVDNELPIVNGNSTFCSNSTESFTIANPSFSAEYNWSIEGGATISNTNGTTVEVNMPYGITNSVLKVTSSINGGCERSQTIDLTTCATVNCEGITLALNTSSICGNEYIFTTLPLPIGTYNWSITTENEWVNNYAGNVLSGQFYANGINNNSFQVINNPLLTAIQAILKITPVVGSLSCAGSQTFEILPTSNEHIIEQGNSVICHGENAEVNLSKGEYEWEITNWSSAGLGSQSISGVINVATSGFYPITILHNFGEVTGNMTIKISPTDNKICYSKSFTYYVKSKSSCEIIDGGIIKGNGPINLCGTEDYEINLTDFLIINSSNLSNNIDWYVKSTRGEYLKIGSSKGDAKMIVSTGTLLKYPNEVIARIFEDNESYYDVILKVLKIESPQIEVFTKAANCNSEGGILIQNSTIGKWEYSIDGGKTWGSSTYYSLKPGSYTLLTRGSSSCIFEYNIDIMIENSIKMDYIFDQDIIYVNVSGGSGNYEYSFDGGNTFQVTNFYTIKLGEPQIQLQVRDTKTGCTLSEIINLSMGCQNTSKNYDWSSILKKYLSQYEYKNISNCSVNLYCDFGQVIMAINYFNGIEERIIIIDSLGDIICKSEINGECTKIIEKCNWIENIYICKNIEDTIKIEVLGDIAICEQDIIDGVAIDVGNYFSINQKIEGVFEYFVMDKNGNQITFGTNGLQSLFIDAGKLSNFDSLYLKFTSSKKVIYLAQTGITTIEVPIIQINTNALNCESSCIKILEVSKEITRSEIYQITKIRIEPLPYTPTYAWENTGYVRYDIFTDTLGTLITVYYDKESKWKLNLIGENSIDTTSITETGEITTTCNIGNGEISIITKIKNLIYSIDNGRNWSKENNIEGLQAGDHTLLVDNKGCISFHPFKIECNEIITPSVTGEDIFICYQQKDIPIIDLGKYFNVTNEEGISEYQYVGIDNMGSEYLLINQDTKSFEISASKLIEYQSIKLLIITNKLEEIISSIKTQVTEIPNYYIEVMDAECDLNKMGAINVTSDEELTNALFSIDGGKNWVKSGNIIDIALGEYLLTIDDQGCNTTMPFKIECSATALQEVVLEVFPNPTSGKVNIKIPYIFNPDALYTLEVLNSNFIIIQRMPLITNEITINLERLNTGYYFIRVADNSNNTSQIFKVFKNL